MDASAPSAADRQEYWPFAEGEATARLALALHAGAPGGDHLDLFLGPAAPLADDALAVRTWRIPVEAWTPGQPVGNFAPGLRPADELPPHRAAYLALGSPRVLSEARGTVHPLFRTECRVAATAARVHVWLQRPTAAENGGQSDRRGAAQELTLVWRAGTQWTIEATPQGCNET